MDAGRDRPGTAKIDAKQCVHRHVLSLGVDATSRSFLLRHKIEINNVAAGAGQPGHGSTARVLPFSNKHRGVSCEHKLSRLDKEMLLSSWFRKCGYGRDTKIKA